jgi:hypothetical protein
MTGAELNTRINKYVGSTDTTFTQAVKLPIVNSVKDEFAAEIVKRNEQLFMMTNTDDLVASSVTAREYALPDDLLGHIFTVEAALDVDDATVFIPALPYTGGLQQLIRNLNGITETKITDAFTNEEPKYILTRRGIYLLSASITAALVTSNGTNGLKVRYRLYPADLANLTGSTGLHVDPTTTSFGVPLAVHELWARRVSIIWKSSRPKPIELSPLEKDFEKDFEKALDLISDDDYGKEEFALLPESDNAENLGANV